MGVAACGMAGWSLEIPARFSGNLPSRPVQTVPQTGGRASAAAREAAASGSGRLGGSGSSGGGGPELPFPCELSTTMQLQASPGSTSAGGRASARSGLRARLQARCRGRSLRLGQRAPNVPRWSTRPTRPRTSLEDRVPPSPVGNTSGKGYDLQGRRGSSASRPAINPLGTCYIPPCAVAQNLAGLKNQVNTNLRTLGPSSSSAIGTVSRGDPPKALPGGDR